MKKIILLFVIVIAAQESFAQNTFPFPATGNLGIGTETALNGLHVFKLNDFNAGSIRFGHSGANDGILNFGWNPDILADSFKISYSPHNSTSSIVDLVTIGLNGNVGIGTSSPSQKLEVNGNGIFQGSVISSSSDNSGGNIRLFNSSKTVRGTANVWTIYNMTGVYGNSLQFWAYDGLGCAGGMCDNRFTIMDSGNVGIGVANPNNKLEVNGTIHSKEVKVDMIGWSDFVFKKEYKLPTLEEVEKHITEKGHLESIPSEEEVVENGINLGEMNAKLLQKIEELTLYVIEQNKSIESLKMEIKNIKSRNK